MSAYTQHVAGPMTDGVQHCVVCGLVLMDYRQAMVPAGDTLPTGWAEGPVYVCGNFWTSEAPRNVTINECRP